MKKHSAVLCAVMCLCCTVTACENKDKSPEPPPVVETEIMGYRPAEIELSGDFEEIISVDTYVGDIYIFGKLKTGGYSGYITDGSFDGYEKMNFVPQKNETVKSSSLLPFGKKAVLTYLDGRTMIYIYGTDGLQEKVLDCGEILESPDQKVSIIPYGREGYIINIDNKRLAQITGDGDYVWDIEVDGSILGTARGADNTVNCLYDNGKVKFTACIDTNACRLTDMKKTDIDSGSFASCTGKEYTYIGVFEDGIYGFRDSRTEKITGFTNMDFRPSDITNIIETDNGYAVSLNNGGMAFITEDNITSLKAKKVIWIGDLGNGKYYSDLNELAELYNENHPDGEYRVDFRVYPRDWQSGTDEIRTDILSGNAPDIIHFNVDMNIDSFGSNNGYFADLYPFIDNDPELSREDFLPNVLTGLERDGKLQQMGTEFYIKTVQARKDVPENWTTDDLIKVYDNRKGNEILTDGNLIMRSNYFDLLFDSSLFIDYNNSECHFDSPEFIKYLKFFQDNEIGLTFKEYDDKAEYDDRERYGSNIVAEPIFNINANLYGMQSLYEYARDNEEWKITGYISDGEKNGTSIVLEDLYGISADSPNIDGAWDFFRTLYTKETKDCVRIYNFPVKTELLDKEFETYSRDLAYVDRKTGKTVIEKRRGFMDEELENFTPEECGYYKDKILSLRVGSQNLEVDRIISQETNKYFEGESTSGQTVQNIQERVSEYLRGE